jgi:L-ascorbate metabolism protein UlaG (beta-lactamase superfamily)
MARHPGFRGGPYVDHEGPSEQIELLLDSTKRELREFIALAAAIEVTANRLNNLSDAGSLEPHYATLPEPLRGLTELRYDLSHRASLRLIEPLVHAKLCTSRVQSVLVRRHPHDARPFALSTPRFESVGSIHARLSFCSEELRALLRARECGVAPEELRAALAPHVTDPCSLLDRIMSLTEPDAGVNPPPRACHEAMDIRYFGHACLLIEVQGTSVMVDPAIAPQLRGGVPRYSLRELPERIDLVLLTHNHQDHVLLETLLQLRDRIQTIVVPRTSGDGILDISLRLILGRCGFRHVADLGELESISKGAVVVTGIPFLGEHGDLSVVGKLGYAIRGAGVTAVALADSNNLDPRLYQLIRAELGPVGALFIGMECAGAPVSWLYGPCFQQPLPRTADQARRLNGSDCARALAVVDALGPHGIFVYAMASEPWMAHVSSVSYDRHSIPIVESNSFLKILRKRGLVAERLYGCRHIRLTGSTCTTIGEYPPEPY